VFASDDEAKILLGRAVVHIGQDYFERVWLKGINLERVSTQK